MVEATSNCDSVETNSFGEKGAENASTETDQTTHHKFKCISSCWKRFKRLSLKYPRSFALIFGVVFPLFLLIGVSLFFGYWIAQLEAPDEMSANNKLIANRALIALSTDFYSNVTVRLPLLCLEIYDDSNKTLNNTLSFEFEVILTRILEEEEAVRGNSTSHITNPQNTSGLGDFLWKCGNEGAALADEFVQRVPLFVDDTIIANDLSFNWIQCSGANTSGTLGQQLWGRPYANKTRLKPDAQQDFAISEWRQQQQQVYNDTLAELLENENVLEAKLDAYEYSIQQANGFEHCYADSVSGAWFWFTIMTTIGYGTQVPVTRGGQAMVYTLGFLSILLFAGILAAAGTIVIAISDDFVSRTKLHKYNFIWTGCLFWGACYYAWMLAIAAYTQAWKANRLDEDNQVDFSEAYWFSYISTTTIGLGDYIVEQQSIVRADLFTFPLLFLVGFVLLSNFSIKLTDLIGALFPSDGRTSLEDKLAQSDLPCLCKSRRPKRKKGGSSVEDTSDTEEKGGSDTALDEEAVQVEEAVEMGGTAGNLKT